MAATTANIVKALKRWGKPTVARYQLHLEACALVGCPPEPFFVFAADVFGTPEHMRDWLLSDEPVEAAEPRTHYAQYTAPKLEEQVNGLFYRDYRKGKR